MFLIGSWKSIEELEEHLTLPELNLLLEVTGDKEASKREFLAAIQGIDINKNKDKQDSKFEDVKRRAYAKALGVSEDRIDSAKTKAETGFGFGMIDD